MTATREHLELVAKALGYFLTKDGRYFCRDSSSNFKWNPAVDQAESAALRDALEIDVQYRPDRIWARNAARLVRSEIIHDGTKEDRSRAVMEAVMAVAVEIGRSE